MDLSGYALTILHQGAGCVLWRGIATATPAPYPASVLVSMPTSVRPDPDRIRMLEHELAMRADLDSTWAVRPLALTQYEGRTALILEDQPGEPLERLLDQAPVSLRLGGPQAAEPAMEIGLFLKLAAGLAAALGEAHRRGLIHKDVRPANVLVNTATGQAWLTGFGIASRLPRERQTPEPPETIAGTLAYMAPEQTGRMNRSIDGRSDLYALGVTLYQTLTGSLPFTAADPIEWVHCHIARQPIAPGERVANVPAPVSAIITKLLAKTAEARYQTAAGLERDLRRCLAQWDAERRIGDFPLGEDDTPDQFVIPEMLYGREREIDTLLTAFDRVVEGSGPELVLVSGYSGSGKSSVVNELHKALVPPRALLAAGKFDQYKRDIPYATIAQALQRLTRTLLTKDDHELDHWRGALLEAVGPNGQLMVDLVPELKVIVGDQPVVPELPPQDAQRRFQLVFRRFLGVFARPEHPLALFLDDLQWLDAATLDVLQDLMIQGDVRYLLLIGAYRDNEVTGAHPLIRRLEAIRGTAGARVHEIALGPLGVDDVCRLIEEALHCDAARAAPLAQLVHEKTAGNPFFAIQFLWALVGEELVTFDHAETRWRWDLTRIQAKGYSDNVIDLLVGALNRLPRNAQRFLRQLACLGHSADGTVLVMTYEDAKEELDHDVQLALQTGLILRSDGAYRFLHDRVQEAAYSLIPEAARAGAHLRIGRLLLAHASPGERREAIFEIVHQLNRGAALITSREDREQLAELNLRAGQRAKAAAAFASALTYLACGAGLLGDDVWERRHDLIFQLELERAECEFLTGQMASAEGRLGVLSSRAVNTVERAAVVCLLADVNNALQRLDRSVAECLGCLRHTGLDLPLQPTEAQARAAYDHVQSTLAGRSIEQLVDLPLAGDAASRATLDVFVKLIMCTIPLDKHLHALVVCAAVDFSMEHGNTDSSCFAYATLGLVAGSQFGDVELGFRFGRLGMELGERKGLRRFQSLVHVVLGSLLMPWVRHVDSCSDLIRSAFDLGNESGDRIAAVTSRRELIANLLTAGEPLAEVEREAEESLEFCRRAGFSDFIDSTGVLAAFVRNLRGLTRQFGALDDERFDELRLREHFATEPHMLAVEFWYWIRRLQARFLAGDPAGALDASIRAQGLRWTAPGGLETADLELYGALARAALCDSVSPEDRRQHLETLAENQVRLDGLARNCRANFENGAALVAAEVARLEGRDLDAMGLYEQAIQSARENGFVHNEALANELAARFHAGRGLHTIAHAYLRSARNGYLLWGADGKVRQLDEAYPHLKLEVVVSVPTGVITAPTEQLDLATVIKVSQAVSAEVVLEKLLDTIMRAAIAHAGAERALLILSGEAEHRIAAEATSSNETVMVRLSDQPLDGSMLPETVFRYVLRTRESVVLDDAGAVNPFSGDSYIAQRHARSVLCVPLTNQAKLIGVLYFENNLAPHAFAPARITVLKLLASQAAVSLDNARLYRDLDEREREARLIVNTIPGLVASLTPAGEVEVVNDQLVDYCGQPVEAMRQWGTNGTVHPEDLPHVAEVFRRGIESGEPYEVEGRVRRFDGVYRWFQIRGLPLHDTRGQVVRWYSLLSDIDDRRRAETERMAAEEALGRSRSELAHVTRLTTMGELTASIAHEVKQPIAAAVTSAQTALRWLDAQPPELGEVREALSRIVRAGKRAGDVVGRIRALVTKAPPRKDAVELNAAIREIVELTRDEAVKNGVSVRTNLAEGVPLIRGDRVQLQQVILNLIMNGIEAMAAAGNAPRELLITSRKDEKGLHVVVADTGPGLAAGALEQVFAAFHTTKADGLGLGLSICRSIIEDHDGRLWASENQGRGAVFQFTLPASVL